jgi:hypothetical protein
MLTFGKHRGQTIDQVPVDYLEWCLRKLAQLEPDMRAAMAAEIQRRSTNGPGAVRPPPLPPPPPPPPPVDPREILGDLMYILEGWYRGLCLRHHPDRGGDPAVMRALNAAYEDLLRRLRQEVEDLGNGAKHE